LLAKLGSTILQDAPVGIGAVYGPAGSAERIPDASPWPGMRPYEGRERKLNRIGKQLESLFFQGVLQQFIGVLQRILFHRERLVTLMISFCIRQVARSSTPKNRHIS
jgi:hypothetical protein